MVLIIVNNIAQLGANKNFKDNVSKLSNKVTVIPLNINWKITIPVYNKTAFLFLIFVSDKNVKICSKKQTRILNK